MKYFNRSKVFVFSLLFIILMFVFLNFNKNFSQIPFVSDGLNQVSSWISKPFLFVKEQKQILGNLLTTYEENGILKEQIETVQDRDEKIASLEKRNVELEELLDLDGSYSSYSSLTANVVNRLPQSWGEEVLLDKGSNEAVTTSMVAVGKNGLIGLVKEVDSHTSRIQLLTSKHAEKFTPVKIKTDKGFVYGLLTGYDQEKAAFVISHLNSQDDIKVDSQVLTSGLGHYPVADIPVGKVVSIKEDKDHLERLVYVESSVDFKDFSVVKLVGGKK